jgi:hypothetical protein
MGNFKDIETLTSNYDLNSDELFENLNAIADKISTGNDPIVTAKKYNNPDYVLTQMINQNHNLVKCSNM